MASADLRQAVAVVRERIEKHRGVKILNEPNTKAILIEPILRALGWNVEDPEEVEREYKRKPKDNPVDYALLLQRIPCLFVEAKPLKENLVDDKWANQIMGYAATAGVQWVVLTNGSEYRIYNSSAPVPVEEKLFRAVAISADEEATVLAILGGVP